MSKILFRGKEKKCKSYSFVRLGVIGLTGEWTRIWLLTIGHAQLLQDQRDLLGIYATIVGHILLTSLVQIHFTFFYITLSVIIWEYICIKMNFNVPSHWRPCLQAPHSSDPQWSQNVNSLNVCTMKRCGTFMLKRFSGTTMSTFLTPGHFVITCTRHRLCMTHVQTLIFGN